MPCSSEAELYFGAAASSCRCSQHTSSPGFENLSWAGISHLDLAAGAAAATLQVLVFRMFFRWLGAYHHTDRVHHQASFVTASKTLKEQVGTAYCIRLSQHVEAYRRPTELMARSSLGRVSTPGRSQQHVVAPVEPSDAYTISLVHSCCFL